MLRYFFSCTLSLLFILSLFNSKAIAQVTTFDVFVNGTIIDRRSGEPLPGATVVVKETVNTEKPIGSSSNEEGEFTLRFKSTLPINLEFSFLGYEKLSKKIFKAYNDDIVIELDRSLYVTDELVVTSQKMSEEELKSTITIDKVSAIQIREIASFDYLDLVGSMREVDVATQSLQFQGVNTRGFNSTENRRFLQLTDGTDIQAPGLSFPVGKILSVSELDVESIELIPGPSSTLYGANAFNGVLSVTSKDPFDYPGVSTLIKVGAHELESSGSSLLSFGGEGLIDASIRYAQPIGKKFGFKINGSILRAEDWKANDRSNIGTPPHFEDHPLNPGYNGVNVYGDEIENLLPLFLTQPRDDSPGGNDADEEEFNPGDFQTVTRSGYAEQDLVDYNVYTTKMNAALYYRFTDQTQFKVSGTFGITDAIYTGDNRVKLDDFWMAQLMSEFTSDNFLLRGYTTQQFSGNSYDVGFLAINLNRNARSDSEWFRVYQNAFTLGSPIHGVPPGNHEAARELADGERFEPGTPEFDQEVANIRNTIGFNNGAAFIDNSRLWHVDTQYKVPGEFFVNSKLEFGGNYRFYDIFSQGTIFADTTGNDITNYEIGLYGKISSSFFDGKLSMDNALRIGKNENFNAHISPQLSASYRTENDQVFRFAFQHGFRYPGPREQFSNQNLGTSRLLGGLPEITSSFDIQENAFTTQALERFNDAVLNDLRSTLSSPEKYNQQQAELRNLSILENAIVRPDQLTTLKPEKVNNFEIGFKQLWGNSFYIDFNYYVSFYTDFIGVTRLVKTRTSPSVDLFTSASQANNSQEREILFIYSNSEKNIIAQGFSYDMEYTSPEGFTVGSNGGWAKLIKSSDDPIVPGFNTPPFRLNVWFGNREIVRDLGFKMTVRHRFPFKWESAFLDGHLGDYTSLDIQTTLRLPKMDSSVKMGMTNFGGFNYKTIYGGPSISSIVYMSFTYNNPFL